MKQAGLHRDNIIPIGPRVLIEPDEPVTKVGQIVIPDKAQKPPARGTVIAIGEFGSDSEGEPYMPVAAGETVIYSQYSGHEIKTDDNVTLILMSLKDILAVVGDAQ